MAENDYFSYEHQDLIQIDNQYKNLIAAIEEYFKAKEIPENLLHESPNIIKNEINKLKNDYLVELELISSFSILAAIDAAFNIDYLQRCYERKLKDNISKTFNKIYKSKVDRPSLVDDILETWKQFSFIDRHIFGNLKGAWKFRNWLAHGRYWKRNFNRYDYFSIFTLAQEIFTTFKFYKL
jgi:hypothetical protein